MKNLTDAQFDGVVEQYTEIVLDRMDYQALEQYVYDSLTDYYGKMTQNELKEHITEMENEDNMFDELVDNLTKDTSPYDKIPERY